MQSPDFGSKGARSARSSRLKTMKSALLSQNLLEGVITVKRIRPTMLLLFTGILIVLVFFGVQLKLPTVSAYPSFASFNASNPTANTCAVSGCHTGKNSSAGAVITFPSGMTSYTPGGKAIPLTVTVPGTTYQTWGFQLNARMASNLNSGGGFFTAGDNGTTSGTGPSSTFTVKWTPPPAGTTDTVNFYLTGNNTSSYSTSNLFSTGMYTLAPAAAAPAGDFSLSASPTSVTTTQGASGTSTISVAALNGFTGSVALSATGMPSGVTATFGSISKAGASTLTLTASSTAATGTSSVTITGTSGTLTHTTTVSLTVNASAPAPAPNFSLSATPYTLTQGGNGSSTITVTPQNGFTGSVALSVSGLPSGVTASAFNPASTMSTSVLTLTASSTAATGTYSVMITGTSGMLTHTAMLNLTVNASAPTQTPNFSLSATPYTLTQGGNGTSTITVTPQYGFTGSVALSVSGLPSGVTASAFNPTSTMSTSVLTLTASSTAATGTYSATITGTSGMLTHTATLMLTVNSASSTSGLTASPKSLTFNYQSGGSTSGSQSVTVTYTGGRAYFWVSTSGGPWLTVSPTSGRTPGTITVSVNGSGMSQGTYSGMIQVNADDAGSMTVPVTLNVTSSTCVTSCGGTTTTIYAEPYVTDPTWSGAVYAGWMNHMGAPTGNPTSPFDPGLELSKNATAPAGTQAGANIKNLQPGSPIPTELGYDYREGSVCTNTSPRIEIVASISGKHVLGGCGTVTPTTPTIVIGTSTTPVPVLGWKRVRVNMSPTALPAMGFVGGDTITSITLVQDQGPDPAVSGSSGGLAVIDNIDINGTFAGKGSSSYTSTTPE